MGGDQTRETAIEASSSVGRWLFGLVLAPLPPAWRGDIDRKLEINIDTVGAPSALVQAGVMFGMWCFGFMSWMRAQMGAVGDMAKAASENVGPGRPEEVEAAAGGLLALGLNPLMPLVYVLTSPVGFFTALFLATGVIRAIGAAATRENLPDPVFTFIEWSRTTLTRSAKHRAREASKAGGPDRLEFGKAESGFDLCIASRLDHDWRVGNTIQVAKDLYELRSIREERTQLGQLRIRYEMVRMPVGAIIRGIRAYRPSEPPEFVD